MSAPPGPRPTGQGAMRPRPGGSGAPLPPGVGLVFEDSGLLVLDKPAGLPVRRVGKGTSLTDIASAYLRLARPDGRALVVHEIDKEASGVVAFAKHPRAAGLLKDSLNAIRGDRSYLALVEGAPQTPEGSIQSHLHRSARGVIESVPASENPQVSMSHRKPAVTHYRTQHTGEGLALLRVRAETDFTGQVRAHLSERGLPIVGDKAYRSTRREIPRVCLHLEELSFRHPGTEKTIRLRAPAPAEFWSMLGAKPPATARPADTRGDVTTTRVTDAEGRPAGRAGWEHVAPWYASFVSTGKSDHHAMTVLPGAARLLDLQPGSRLLDVGCGEGVFERWLAQNKPGAQITGVDASEGLIERANASAPPGSTFLTGDARTLDQLALEPASFDACVSVLALMNIDPLDDVLRGVASLVRPGGSFVGVILHPAFRSPGISHWGWTTSSEDAQRTQFRRIDAYLSERPSEIVMNPGAVAGGEDPVTTTTHHRPIGRYAEALGAAGFTLESLEEWASARTSEPGPRADEENRARAEFPMFLAFRARRIAETRPEPAPTG